MSESYSLQDLLYLMARLREPGFGCPWDLQQDFRSITPSTIEEAYEVVDTIEKGDYLHLKEELGDLLFQVVFYSQLAREDGIWNFTDVVHTLTEKLVRRHPHVFPGGDLHSRRESGEQPNEAEIKQSWEAIKRSERAEKGKHRVLDDVPVGLPAATRAEKLQKRAAKVGFDWPSVEGVIDKINEEMQELNEALAAGNADSVEDEMGDLLFAIVNLARHLKIQPEQALRRANAKFERRFGLVEDTLISAGSSVEEASLEQMEEAWQNAKNHEN